MKPEQNDKWLEATIRRAVGSENAQFDAASWKKKYHQEVALLESRNTHTATTGHRKWRTLRTIMSNRSIKIAASAGLAAVIVVAVIIFAAGGGSTIAMADVLKKLQTKCYEFEMSVRTKDGAGTSFKGMVLEPGKMRLEQRSGLGTISSIIDNDTGQSLILFERLKAAYRFDRKEAKAIGVLGFLILPRRSIEDLWGLKAGDEIALGKKNIDGESAEGFRVTQKDKEYSQTITVWADAKTGNPLEVEIVWQSNEQEKAVLELTLSDFRVIPEPNKALFSTKVPAKYTLANRQTLEQLTAKSDTTSSTAITFSPIMKVDGWDADRLAKVGITVCSWKHDVQSENPPMEWVQVTFDCLRLPKNHDVVMTAWIVFGTQTVTAVRAERNDKCKDTVTVVFAVQPQYRPKSHLDIFIWEDTSDGGKKAHGYKLSLDRIVELARKEAVISSTENTSAQAKIILDAIALWADGKKQKAVKLLVGVDWSDDIQFGQEHYLFTMTERQYISLVSDDQSKVMAEIMTQSTQCRAIARELVKLGRKAHTSKDVVQAEKYFSTAVSLGQLLNRNRDVMLIVRLVGIAIQKLALTELSSLYEELGETQKRQKTQGQINQIEEQMKQIKKSVSGR